MGMIVRNEKTYTGISSASLSTLTDVTLEAPVNGQGLVYNEETQTWTNGNVASGGGIGTSAEVEWGIATLEADVETTTSVGYVIPFNKTVAKSILTFDTENHGFILKAGKTYELEASVRAIGSQAWRYFVFYDNTNQTKAGIAGCCETTGAYADATTPAKLIITPKVDTLFTVIVNSVSSETTQSTIIMASYLKVTELKSSVTYVDGVIKPWLYDSENEVIIGVYDGKPLYRKKVNIVLPSTAYEYTSILHNISDVEEIFINHNYSYLVMENGSRIPINTVRPSSSTNINGNMSIWSIVGVENISVVVGGIYVDCQATFILEYTKTTDEEGSGNSLMPYGWTDAVISDILGGSS